MAKKQDTVSESEFEHPASHYAERCAGGAAQLGVALSELKESYYAAELGKRDDLPYGKRIDDAVEKVARVRMLIEHLEADARAAYHFARELERGDGGVTSAECARRFGADLKRSLELPIRQTSPPR